jgi:DNA-binding XRE family transcriptional regulator
MKIIKKPKTFGTWLTMKMLVCDIDDLTLAKNISVTSNTIASWKQNRNLPKLPAILSMVRFFFRETGESPTDLMDELLESIHVWREMNKEYRVANVKQPKDIGND